MVGSVGASVALSVGTGICSFVGSVVSVLEEGLLLTLGNVLGWYDGPTLKLGDALGDVLPDGALAASPTFAA